MWRQLRVLVIVAVLLVSGALAGSYSNRWGVPVDLGEAGKRIEACPAQIGRWELQTAKPFDLQAQKILQCSGSTLRYYRNRDTGEIIQLALLVGPSGPTSVHTPDICFVGQDYTPVAPAQRVAVHDAVSASFWEQVFRSNGLHGEMLRVAYTWNDGTGWVASEHPRFQFAGARLLYKLQVVTRSGPGDVEQAPDSSGLRRFIEALLPELDRTVCSENGQS